MVWQLMTVVMMAAQAADAGQSVGQDRVNQLRAGMQEIAERLQPPVTLTAPLVGTDGSRRGPAITVTDTESSYYVASGQGSCDASISATEPANVRDGWRITSRIVSRNAPRSATVAVEWQRMWSGGRPLPNGTRARTQVELRTGDSVHLDHLEIAAPGLACHGQLRTLELQIFGNVIQRAPDRPILAPPTPMKMDVWLVHHTPADVETTYALSMAFDPAETRFVFRTHPITTHDGTFYVDLDGAVRTLQREDGSLGLWTGLKRAIVDTSTNMVRVATGSGGSVIAWGQAGEVISFDLPPLVPQGTGIGTMGIGSGSSQSGRGVATGGIGGTHTHPGLTPLLGHKFSVRLRFTPAK